MYLDFFQLQREPFYITPDPAFFFPSPGHREALAALLYGVEQRKGFIAVTGEVGVGKTTILRAFLERIDQGQTKSSVLIPRQKTPS
jgi:general secretion pathway protein A